MKRRTKLVQNLLMDLVVLIVNLGLHSPVADLDATEKFVIFRGVESLAALTDLVQ